MAPKIDPEYLGSTLEIEEMKVYTQFWMEYLFAVERG